jgi:8-oxo-dGTP pyrophosphatase MutT (NUDIX family)
VSGILDRLWRLGLFLAYRGALLLWFLTRPRHEGALVALWHEQRVLVLRFSYRRALGLPGGGMRRGERAADAAARELAEELGLTVAPGSLRLAFEVATAWEYRRNHVRIFELELTRVPAIAIDRREVTAAFFMTADEALAQELVPDVRAYLATREFDPGI